MRTDGQTDMKKLIVAFRNFTRAPPKKTKTVSFALLTNVVRVTTPGWMKYAGPGTHARYATFIYTY